MTVFLVRHALLDDAATGSGRGLSDRGRRQAQRVADSLDDRAIERVISSPAIGCVQTVQPLASARGLAVETSELLDAEPVDIDAVMSLLLATCGAGAVVCCGSDVVAAAVHAVRGRGAELVLPEGDTSVRWEKGSIWVLECEDARFVRAVYVPPPPRTATAGAHTHPSFTADAPRRARS